MAASTLAASTAHLGRTSPTAAEELVAVSSRCAEFAETITAAALYDWDSPQRLRELSASRMPTAHEVAEIASRLYRAVAPALDLPHPDRKLSGSRRSPARSPRWPPMRHTLSANLY